MLGKKESDFALAIFDDMFKIKKELLASLYFNFRRQFPDEPEKDTAMRAHIVVSELLLLEIEGIKLNFFRGRNRHFIESAKSEVMKIQDFKKGVLCFLASTAALYKLQNHPNAGKWVDPAKKIDPEVKILSSLEAVREEVNSCLSYYLSRSA
jgi:hypothetical protein